MSFYDIGIRDSDVACRTNNPDLTILNGKTILVTGATGLIGSNIIKVLAHLKKSSLNNLKIMALVRNIEKAKQVLGDDYTSADYILGDVNNQLETSINIDYIIHAAAQTNSKAFVNKPVETIQTSFQGTINLLELARKKHINGFVYLSSMEVYGTPQTDQKINESFSTNIDTMLVRSSYPEGKRICEAICTAYYSEYGVPVKVVRLTQTIGPGVDYYDGRVFAEFARCAIEKRDIVLHTKGETKRSYLSTEDAVDAILTVLLHGKSGEAYNAANEETYCTIYEMAKMVAAKCAEGQIAVQIQPDDVERGYAPALKMNLDTQKLCNLGWQPKLDLYQMFEALISSMKTMRKK